MPVPADPFIGSAALCERYERTGNGHAHLIGVIDRVMTRSQDTTAAGSPRCLVLQIQTVNCGSQHTISIRYGGTDAWRYFEARQVRLDACFNTIAFTLSCAMTLDTTLTIDVLLDGHSVTQLAISIVDSDRR